MGTGGSAKKVARAPGMMLHADGKRLSRCTTTPPAADSAARFEQSIRGDEVSPRATLPPGTATSSITTLPDPNLIRYAPPAIAWLHLKRTRRRHDANALQEARHHDATSRSASTAAAPAANARNSTDFGPLHDPQEWIGQVESPRRLHRIIALHRPVAGGTLLYTDASHDGRIIDGPQRVR